ncbi:MAG: M20/M25/M40 family metallo-hydrolase [Planctomycetes bacterium]|nr:M20/M25/M40 family metallo-hydrolase [Planctomycetota bacterium]
MNPEPAALNALLELLRIPGTPGEERGVCEHLKKKLAAFGVPEDSMALDRANELSEYGGNCGNLIVTLEGHGHGERRMFSTHMDTVPDCVGAIPRVDGAFIVNDAPGKALGGDNRTGCAVLLEVARALMAKKGDHAPAMLAFLIQEEVGLVGARHLNLEMLGSSKPSVCYNFDGGITEQVIYKVIGTERFHIEIEGVAAHAGAHPEQGVSAALVAAHALSELDGGGWHGKIKKHAGEGSANCGILRGGTGSNVIMPALYALAEARSHDKAFRKTIVAQWQDAFRRAAERVRNHAGRSACVSFRPGPWYEAYALDVDSPAVQVPLAALKRYGVAAYPGVNDGGMDANWIAAHGIPAVTLGCGQQHVHTPNERINLDGFAIACRLGAELATA